MKVIGKRGKNDESQEKYKKGGTEIKGRREDVMTEKKADGRNKYFTKLRKVTGKKEIKKVEHTRPEEMRRERGHHHCTVELEKGGGEAGGGRSARSFPNKQVTQ